MCSRILLLVVLYSWSTFWEENAEPFAGLYLIFNPESWIDLLLPKYVCSGAVFIRHSILFLQFEIQILQLFSCVNTGVYHTGVYHTYNGVPGVVRNRFKTGAKSWFKVKWKSTQNRGTKQGFFKTLDLFVLKRCEDSQRIEMENKPPGPGS